MPADRANDPDYLKTQQYRDAGNLSARAALHAHFTTNRYPLGRWIFDQLLAALPPEARVLEVGCGPGGLWRENLDRLPPGWHFTLTDLSPGMIAAARAALAGHEAHFTFAEADVQALAYPAAAFDAVVASYMLYHVPDRPRAMAAIARVLRPGGQLFATTSGPNNLHELKALIAAHMPGSDVPLAESWFHLGNGAAQLAPYFAEVIMLPYEDGLIVTEVQPVVDYVRSLPPEHRPADEQMPALERDVAERIARDGAWRIQKATGMFVATKAR